MHFLPSRPRRRLTTSRHSTQQLKVRTRLRICQLGQQPPPSVSAPIVAEVGIDALTLRVLSLGSPFPAAHINGCGQQRTNPRMAPTLQLPELTSHTTAPCLGGAPFHGLDTPMDLAFA